MPVLTVRALAVVVAVVVGVVVASPLDVHLQGWGVGVRVGRVARLAPGEAGGVRWGVGGVLG